MEFVQKMSPCNKITRTTIKYWLSKPFIKHIKIQPQAYPIYSISIIIGKTLFPQFIIYYTFCCRHIQYIILLYIQQLNTHKKKIANNFPSMFSRSPNNLNRKKNRPKQQQIHRRRATKILFSFFAKFFHLRKGI